MNKATKPSPALNDDIGYKNCYCRDPEAYKLFDKAVSVTPGWNPTPASKLDILEDYRHALKEKLCVNRSEAALEECLKFKYTQGGSVEHSGVSQKDDPTAGRENHGDITIADALAWKMVREYAKRPVKTVEEERRAMNCLQYRIYLADQRQRETEEWQ